MPGSSSFYHRWKWVFLYSLFLYSTIYFVPATLKFIHKLEMGWAVRYGPGVVLFFLCCFLLHRLLCQHVRYRKLSLGLLGGVGILYGFLIFQLSSQPVERFHLLEYGFLGFLIFRAITGRYKATRVILYSLIMLLVIGFLDEVIQGILPERYYDMRDVRVNLIAGGLVVLLLAFFQAIDAFPAPSAVPKEGPKSSKAYDILALCALLIVVVSGWTIQDVNVNLRSLQGLWTAASACGGNEMFEFFPDGRFSWRGNLECKTEGRYYLEGNRLDGAKIFLIIDRSTNESECGIRMPKTSNLRTAPLNLENDLFSFGEYGPFQRKNH